MQTSLASELPSPSFAATLQQMSDVDFFSLSIYNSWSNATATLTPLLERRSSQWQPTWATNSPESKS